PSRLLLAPSIGLAIGGIPADFACQAETSPASVRDRCALISGTHLAPRFGGPADLAYLVSGIASRGPRPFSPDHRLPVAGASGPGAKPSRPAAVRRARPVDAPTPQAILCGGRHAADHQRGLKRQASRRRQR